MDESTSLTANERRAGSPGSCRTYCSLPARKIELHLEQRFLVNPGSVRLPAGTMN